MRKLKHRTPKNWSEITVQTFVELQGLEPSEFESGFDYQLTRISILLDEDIDELEENLTVEELTELHIKTKWVNEKPKVKAQKKLGEFYLKEWKNLTLADFIDLQNLCSKGYYLNAKKILAILYRKRKTGDWGEVLEEPRKAIDLDLRAKEFEDLPVSETVGAIHDYVDFQKDFIERRKGLFGIEEEPEPEDETEIEIDEEEKREIEAEKKEEEKSKKWGWNYFVYKLCGGDLTKAGEVLDLKIGLVFNFEAMKKELKIQD